MLIFNCFEKKIISKYIYNIHDTGSTEAQIILLSIKIKNLKNHILKNKKDFSSKRGFSFLNNKIFKLLKYLKKKNLNNYCNILKDLNIKIE